MDKRIQDLKADQETLTGKLSAAHERQHEELIGLYATLDQLLVSPGIIGELDEAQYQLFEGLEEIVASANPDTTTSTPRLPPAAVEPTLHQHKTPPSGSGAKRQPSDADTVVVDQAVVLRGDYHAARNILRGAVEDLEMRYDRFEKEGAELEETIESYSPDDKQTALLEFDQYELRETRRLTRAVARAESDLAKAKAACLAADVDIASSNLESGFRDDVDDGYRISEETEMIASADPDFMRGWLDQIPDLSAADQDNAAIIAPDDVDVDDWDAKSVEIEDVAV